MIDASIRNAVRALVITSLAGSALGHPGEVRSSIRIPVIPSPGTLASRRLFRCRAELGSPARPGVDHRCRPTEPQLSGTLDEAHHPHRVGGVGPITRTGPFGCRQQPATLVVPQRLGVDLRLRGDLTGSQTTRMNPVPDYQVKPTRLPRCPVGSRHDVPRCGVTSTCPRQLDLRT
jgi:hypothetical protein